MTLWEWDATRIMTRIIKRLSISFEKLAWKMEQKGIMLYYFDQNTNLIVFRQKCSFCRSFWFFALILSCSLLFINQIICRSFTKKEQKKAKRAKKVQIILWSNNRAYHNNDLNKPMMYNDIHHFKLFYNEWDDKREVFREGRLFSH